MVVEIHRLDDARAIGKVTLLVGHPRSSWTTVANVNIEMAAHDFDALGREVDGELSRGEPQLINRDDEIIACTDGPGFLTERRKDGRSTWLSGFCGDHPNNRIASLMRSLASASIQRWLPAFP